MSCTWTKKYKSKIRKKHGRSNKWTKQKNPALDISSAFDKIVENTSYDFTTSQYYHLVLPLFEDNILVIEQDINLICPLTKSKLVDPVIR